MAYRDESASLEERHRQLRRALEETRARSSLLTQEEAKIHEELAGLHRELQSSLRQNQEKRNQEKRKLPLANTLIASPCNVPWDQMVGNDRVRHCGQCKLDVHNLSAMTHDEVDQFLTSLGSKNPKPAGERLPCINLFQRADGTIITSDCPVGVRMRMVRSFLAASLGVGVAALIGFTALACLSFWQTRSSHRMVDSSAYDDSQERRTPVLISPPRYIPNTGYISVEGPAGLDVYDGNGHVGMTPMTFSASEGSHTLHVVDRDGKTEYATTYVRSQSVSHVTVGLKPVEQPVIRMAGAPPPMRGAMMKRDF